MKNKSIFFAVVLSLMAGSLFAQPQKPTGLTTDLLEHTDYVWVGGYPAGTLADYPLPSLESANVAEIRTQNPSFGWIVNDTRTAVKQSAYRVLVASSAAKLDQNEPDLWDSGVDESPNSVAITYAGKALSPQTTYYWKVKTYNNGQESPWSDIKRFRTASELYPYAVSTYPVQKQDQQPVNVRSISSGIHAIDFGKSAFGQLSLTLTATKQDTVEVHLGECIKNRRVDRNPGGSRRYAQYQIRLLPGTHTYQITLRPDPRNTSGAAILMPQFIGEVYPFRYVEVGNYHQPLTSANVKRTIAHYPFNQSASYFNSSDSVLNQVWDLCKYSIQATSYLGIYVDGDRERIPYEGDAYINQLAHYCVDREYSMARYSHHYLVYHPTWPTEFSFQTLFIAWNDYLYTGNLKSAEALYTDLKAKILLEMSDEKGFFSSRIKPQTSEFLASIYQKENLRDLIDWPHTGILGLGKNEGGETDGFVFQDINTGLNAYHYGVLQVMAQFAGLLNKPEDEQRFKKQMQRLKKSFNDHLFDKKQGAYVDGIGTDHASLHANMLALHFGLANQKQAESVCRFIRSRGMACSVYGAQFLMDALYNYHQSDYALQLLNATTERSWYNMIRMGSTITTEAWDNKYKPNQDWNHAWGAVPANVIPRKLMGIQPLLPGFEKVRIMPQPDTLSYAEIRYPTIRGEIALSFRNDNRRFEMTVTIPANMEADIYLPCSARKYRVMQNSIRLKKTEREGNFVKISAVGSGQYQFVLESVCI